MEEGNKYWLGEEERACIFYGQEFVCLSHYVKNCNKIKNWFTELVRNKKERLKRIQDDELNKVKKDVLRKLWREGYC